MYVVVILNILSTKMISKMLFNLKNKLNLALNINITSVDFFWKSIYIWKLFSNFWKDKVSYLKFDMC